jgi:glycosyltransferase involved in cell wall biosynthesis
MNEKFNHQDNQGYLILSDNNVIDEAIGLIGSILKNAPKRIHLVAYNVDEDKLELLKSHELITIEELPLDIPGSYHHLALQLQTYIRSPFDNTLYIDTDMFIMQNIDHVFEMIEKLGYFVCTDWDNHWMKAKTFSRTYPQIWDIYNIPSEWADLPMLNAGLIGYKKSNPKIENILDSVKNVDFTKKDIFTDQCFINYFFRREFGEHLLFFSDHLYNSALVNQKDYNPQLRRTIIHHHVRKTKRVDHLKMQSIFQNYFYESIGKEELKTNLKIKKPKITYLFKNGRLSRMNSSKNYPKEMFYGADRLENVTIKESANIKRGRGLFILIDKFLKLELFTFSDIYKLFITRGDYGIVSSISISMSAMRGLLNKLFRKDKKAICFSMSSYYQKFNRIERRLFNWVKDDIIFISISRYDYKILQDKLAPTCHYLVEFGIDTEFWKMDEDEKVDEEYYFAIGMDKSRDWNTLIEAFRNRDEKLVIINNKEHTNLPSNITHINGSFYKNSSLSDEDIKDYYKKAKAVIIPLVETGQPSGQSVCLQAMAMNKPVIITITSGLWSKKLREKENSFLVNEKDSSSIIEAICFIESNKVKTKQIAKCGYDLVKKNFTYNQFVRKLENIIESEVHV